MRVPPNAGPRVVECIPIIAFNPVSSSLQNTTCSWALNEAFPKIPLAVSKT